MVQKTYGKDGLKARTTFKLPAQVNASEVALIGEFNEWNPTTHPMKQLKDGSWSVSLSLPAGQQYRYRYVIDGGARWENDWEAEAYLPNEFGTEDSVVTL